MKSGKIWILTRIHGLIIEHSSIVRRQMFKEKERGREEEGNFKMY
jgi:hypothetical protein